MKRKNIMGRTMTFFDRDLFLSELVISKSKVPSSDSPCLLPEVSPWPMQMNRSAVLHPNGHISEKYCSLIWTYLQLHLFL